MQSAKLAHSRICFSQSPVALANSLRPLEVLAFSSSVPVVRMPWDFSFEAARAPNPSICVRGYVIAMEKLLVPESREGQLKRAVTMAGMAHRKAQEAEGIAKV